MKGKENKEGKISKGRKIERIKLEKCNHPRIVAEKENTEGQTPWILNGKFRNRSTLGFAREEQTRFVWMHVNACYKILERRGLTTAVATLGLLPACNQIPASWSKRPQKISLLRPRVPFRTYFRAMRSVSWLYTYFKLKHPQKVYLRNQGFGFTNF